MKRKIFGLIVTLLLATVLVISGCDGSGDTTASSTTSKATSPTTSQTTSSTTKTTTSTPLTSTPSSTTSKTISTTSTTSTSTTSTSTTITTSSTTSSTSSTESLEDILANASGIDSVYYEMVTTGAGMSQQTTKVWLKGNMMRTEMTAEGTTIISIYNSDEETAYAYYPDMGMVMVITYQPQESAADETEGVTNYSPTILGTENYDGKVCLVIQYTYEGTTTKMWIWKQYGFAIKMEVTSSEGTYTVEYKNIVFNSVTDDVFVLPSGLTTMTVQV